MYTQLVLASKLNVQSLYIQPHVHSALISQIHDYKMNILRLIQTYFKQKLRFSNMSGHQSTADMVNCELDQLQGMMNPSVDMLMADMNFNPDFSIAQDVHGTLENNTQSYDLGGHGNTSI